MTMKEIQAWINERVTMPQRREYIDGPRSTITRVWFENGDTYEQRSTDITLYGMKSEYIINGVTVRRTAWAYHNFGWKEVQTA